MKFTELSQSAFIFMNIFITLTFLGHYSMLNAVLRPQNVCNKPLLVGVHTRFSAYIAEQISRQHFCFKLVKQKRSTEGCSKFKGPETRQVQERLVSTLEHMQVPKWDRTRCPEE